MATKECILPIESSKPLWHERWEATSLRRPRRVSFSEKKKLLPDKCPELLNSNITDALTKRQPSKQVARIKSPQMWVPPSPPMTIRGPFPGLAQVLKGFPSESRTCESTLVGLTTLNVSSAFLTLMLREGVAQAGVGEGF